ncbi:DUF6957 family protein [Stutzerimonas stutzeri]|uniref:DUF6957 family protein n=1 Tax=Stutzerimonas stutzeri TaxID=316 RepID=UPI0024B79753|nr:hypothetical protein [Stutzerimonas stutzeri]MDI9738435.1 hypothetical protein [Stutzerimonas stutzeri]
MATLEEVMAVLYSAGEPMPGSCMSDDEALAYARQHLVYGGYCLVRNWRWLDLKVTESQRLMLAKTVRHSWQPKRHHPLVKSSGYFIEIQN